MRYFDQAIAALGAIVVAGAVPVFVLGNNIGNFGRIDLSFLLLCIAAISVIGFLLVSALLWVAGLIGASFYECARFSLYFSTSLVFLTGLVLPLTSHAEQVEIEFIRTNWTNAVMALVLAVVSAFALRSKLRNALLVGMSVIVLSVLSTNLFSAHSALSSASSRSIYTASEERNIFVFGMDGVSGPIVNDILRKSPELLKEFSNFRIFENAISSAPATFSSLTSVVLGDVDLGRNFGTMAGIAEKLDRSRLLPNKMERDGFEVSSYVYDNWHDNTANSHTIGTLLPPPVMREKISDAIGLYRYAFARVFSPSLTFSSRWGPRVIHWLDTAGAPIGQTADLRTRILNHKGVDWDAQNVLSALDFETYIDELSVGTSKPVAHFVHFLHPHFPVDFDAGCRYRSDNERWFIANQSRDGVVSETRCFVQQYVEFIKKIKELGIFDSSMIVLHSDHGIPAGYNQWQYTDPEELESFLVRGHPNWGYARYTPFLAIKPFGSSSTTPLASEGRAVIDRRPVILSDLAKTICQESMLSDCVQYPGFDILQPGELPKDATYFVNLVRDRRSTHLLDTHETVRFDRSIDFLGELNDYLTAEITRQPVPCGRVSIVEGDRFNNGYTDNSSWVSWQSGGSFYIRLRIPECSAGRLIVQGEGPLEYAQLNATRVQVPGSIVTLDVRENRGEVITIKMGARPEIFEAL
ncbi:hypothetical protein [Shinella sumterensis]|uniref:hypothetical protein n=1 Tax=Shinella sumterensis TaxID=1967501 RepID=UPI003F87792B